MSHSGVGSGGAREINPAYLLAMGRTVELVKVEFLGEASEAKRITEGGGTLRLTDGVTLERIDSLDIAVCESTDCRFLVSGDITLEFRKKKKKLLSVSFNVGFIDPRDPVITFDKDTMDKLCKDTDHEKVPATFQMRLTFNFGPDAIADDDRYTMSVMSLRMKVCVRGAMLLSFTFTFTFIFSVGRDLYLHFYTEI